MRASGLERSTFAPTSGRWLVFWREAAISHLLVAGAIDGTNEIGSQTRPRPTYPTDAPRGYASHQSIVRNIAGYDGACCNEAVLAKRMPAHYGRVGADA